MYAHIPLMLKTLEEGRGSREGGRERPEEKLLPWLMLLQLLTFMGGKTIDNKYSTHTHVKTLSRDSNKIINALAPRLQPYPCLLYTSPSPRD